MGNSTKTETDKWEKLKNFLKNSIDEINKMNFYEYSYHKQLTIKDVYEKMLELEKNEV